VSGARHIGPHSGPDASSSLPEVRGRLYVPGYLVVLFAVAVVTPCYSVLITRLVLLGISLNQTLRGRPAPYVDDIMASSPGWPPFTGTALPFWASVPVLMVLATISVARPRLLDGAAFAPRFVAAYLLTAGGWSIYYAAMFSESDAWPRDSAVAGLSMLVAGVLVGLVALASVFRARLRRPADRWSGRVATAQVKDEDRER